MTQPTRHGPYLRGQIFQARFAFVRETYGSRGIEKVLAALPGDCRRRLSGVDLETWYSFSTLVSLDHAIRQALAPEDEGIYERMGYARPATAANGWASTPG
jgi:hypothetical protein